MQRRLRFDKRLIVTTNPAFGETRTTTAHLNRLSQPCEIVESGTGSERFKIRAG